MSESLTVLRFVSILLIPFAAAGIALINMGLGRARNAAHALLSALLAIAAAAVTYLVAGFAVQGYPGGLSWTVVIAGKPWAWMGCVPLMLRGIALDNSEAAVVALFGMMAAGVAAMIPLGGAAERWRLGASCLSAAVLAGFIYPLFAHWAWVGWLRRLGENYELGRGFLDTGGAGAIHTTGGLCALAMVWILGPRRGKYTREGMPMAIPGHHSISVLFGCLLAWIGFLGLASAGSTLFAPSPNVALAAINTTLAAAGGVLTAAGITRARFRKIDASLCANGWVAGLVSSSAGCASMRPAAAVLVGAIGGALAIYAIEWLELHLSIDDPGGVISVHALGGIWSLLAAGIVSADAPPGQWLAQVAGITTLVGFVLPVALSLNWLLARFVPPRVPPEAERQGLDLHELGASAYPDFMTHNEDSWLR